MASVFHPNTESELSTRPRKRGHLEIEIYVENLNKKLFGLTKDGPYHRPTNIKYKTHLGIMISWLKILSGMAGMWSFFSLAKFMIWNSTSLINDSNAARLVLVSSRAFARSILHKMLLLHSICLWQRHEGHETLVNQITSDVCQPFGAVWLAVSFWAHDMQIDEPLLPINALCFVDKPTWVSVFLVEEGEAYLRYSVQPLILIRRKMT